MDELRAQYERHPYPPIPWTALPKRDQGQGLCLDTAGVSHKDKSILVVGAGTLEPLVVAQANPHASHVTALDFSQNSISKLQKRLRLAKFTGRRLPRVSLIQSDFMAWETNAKFDYIVASNVLHHLPNPAEGLARLTSLLSEQGVIRLVTYPKASRIWMRQTSLWLKNQGLNPSSANLVKRTRDLISTLPLKSPYRSCYESQPEVKQLGGLIDAFYNARENPLSPMQWGQCCEALGLELIAETQTQTSQSSFLEELLPTTRALSVWIKLEILDLLLELCANPIFWLQKVQPTQTNIALPKIKNTLTHEQAELAQNLREVQRLLQNTSITLLQVREILVKEVGQRTAPSDRFGKPGRTLPGLSITDYDWEELLKNSTR